MTEPVTAQVPVAAPPGLVWAHLVDGVAMGRVDPATDFVYIAGPWPRMGRGTVYDEVGFEGSGQGRVRVSVVEANEETRRLTVEYTADRIDHRLSLQACEAPDGTTVLTGTHDQHRHADPVVNSDAARLLVALGRPVGTAEQRRQMRHDGLEQVLAGIATAIGR